MWIRACALSHFLSHDIILLFLSLKVIYWHSAAYYCTVPKAHQSQNYFWILFCSKYSCLKGMSVIQTRQLEHKSIIALTSYQSIYFITVWKTCFTARFTSEDLIFHPGACSHFDLIQQFQSVLPWPLLNSLDWFYDDITSSVLFNLLFRHRKISQCKAIKKPKPPNPTLKETANLKWNTFCKVPRGDGCHR